MNSLHLGFFLIVYVSNDYSDSVSVISTAKNTVTATLTGLNMAEGAAVTPPTARMRAFILIYNCNIVFLFLELLCFAAFKSQFSFSRGSLLKNQNRNKPNYPSILKNDHKMGIFFLPKIYL